MSTNRHARRRHHKRHINQRAIDAFTTALPLRLHREQQIGDDTACEGIEACPICAEYEDNLAVIAAELKLRPWEMSPVDVANVPPPPGLNKQDATQWESARELYVELCRAAGLTPATRCEISDGIRSHNNIR